MALPVAAAAATQALAVQRRSERRQPAVSKAEGGDAGGGGRSSRARQARKVAKLDPRSSQVNPVPHRLHKHQLHPSGRRGGPRPPALSGGAPRPPRMGAGSRRPSSSAGRAGRKRSRAPVACQGQHSAAAVPAVLLDLQTRRQHRRIAGCAGRNDAARYQSEHA
jgi:hypothetical protein